MYTPACSLATGTAIFLNWFSQLSDAARSYFESVDFQLAFYIGV